MGLDGQASSRQQTQQRAGKGRCAIAAYGTMGGAAGARQAIGRTGKRAGKRPGADRGGRGHDQVQQASAALASYM